MSPLRRLVTRVIGAYAFRVAQKVIDSIIKGDTDAAWRTWCRHVYGRDVAAFVSMALIAMWATASGAFDKCACGSNEICKSRRFGFLAFRGGETVNPDATHPPETVWAARLAIAVLNRDGENMVALVALTEGSRDPRWRALIDGIKGPMPIGDTPYGE